MGANSAIEWTDHTFNPWTGCLRVSPGCDNCYAAAQAKRNPGVFGSWEPGAPRKRTSDAYWRKPLAWNAEAARTGKRARVFCASMADVFDNQAEAAWRDDLWALIHHTPHLDWLLLTKRPQNIAGMLPADRQPHHPAWGDGWPNVWLGTTVENQAEADRRIPHLLRAPARVRFLSCEPLLGPVDLTAIDLPGGDYEVLPLGAAWLDRLAPGEEEGPRIDWVISGGESGHGARPSHPDWHRSLRDQCAAAGAPYFFKQWGEWLPGTHYTDELSKADPGDFSRFDCMDWEDGKPVPADGEWGCDMTGDEVYRVGKKRAGALLDGREHREFPEARADG